jgi:hypothetical protein
LDGFDILIIDDDNNNINFNNINWTMSMLLTIVRKKNTINNIKFRDVLNSQSYNQPIELNQEKIPIQEEIPVQEEMQVQEEEPIQEDNNYNYEIEEPITDDLDLLLYNNHGQIY